MEEIIRECPVVQSHVEDLWSIMSRDYSLPHVHVFGANAYNASNLIKRIAKLKDLYIIFVDCLENGSSSALEFYGEVLRAGASARESGVNDEEALKVDSADTFISTLTTVLEDVVGEGARFCYLVLDHVERLRFSLYENLAVLLNISKFTNVNTSLISISQLPWSKICCRTGLVSDCLQICLPAYDKDELLAILVSSCPEGVGLEAYRIYAKIIVDVFYQYTRNVKDLHFIAIRLHNRVANVPQLEQSKKEQCAAAMWRNLKPLLDDIPSQLYFRICAQNCLDRKLVSSLFNMELPFFTKYLLTAAYIASYNPVSSDKRFFLKDRGKTKVKRKQSQSFKKTFSASGPKVFTFQRWIAIFLYLVEDDVRMSSDVLGQIATLCRLRLVNQVSSTTVLSVAKYRCMAPFEVVRQVASTVKIDLVQYLYDYVLK